MLTITASVNTRVTFFFFFNDTATTEIYTLSLHDALPIYRHRSQSGSSRTGSEVSAICKRRGFSPKRMRSEEHTSELQSHLNLVCRLLLEKKNNNNKENINMILIKQPRQNTRTHTTLDEIS